MSQQEKTRLTLESSQSRRKQYAEVLLKDPAVKGAVQRDQNPARTEGGKDQPREVA
jgi:hypothetical protein